MSETTTPTPDEQSQKSVAAKVITEKRKYFFPVEGKTVEATSLESATAQVKKQAEKESN
jgi:hypothetical protein